ncbi:hypothetical protein Tco_0147790, partial [Tanacetum coccineum]
MADVRCLSVYVIKLRDMPEGVLVLSGLSHVWKSRICDLTDPSEASLLLHSACCCRCPDDLDVGTHSAKILAKDEVSQKRKASTSGATSSHVAKHTRSALAQSSSSTTSPGPFMNDSDNESDDD